MGDGHLLMEWLKVWGGWVFVLFGVVLVLHGLVHRVGHARAARAHGGDRQLDFHLARVLEP